jgi:hypothetical protein
MRASGQKWTLRQLYVLSLHRSFEGERSSGGSAENVPLISTKLWNEWSKTMECLSTFIGTNEPKHSIVFAVPNHRCKPLILRALCCVSKSGGSRRSSVRGFILFKRQKRVLRKFVNVLREGYDDPSSLMRRGRMGH